MDDPNSQLQWLTKMSKRPMDQVTYLPNADAKVIDSIEVGVLFLMAFWSAGAVKAFTALSEVLATSETDSLEFVVADVDGSPSLYEVPEFKGNIHGWGETAWIYQGKIIATSGLGLNTERFRPNTSTLLAFNKHGSHVTPTQIAAEFHWLPPWADVGDVADSLDSELAKELFSPHSLRGVTVQAIGKRTDCDDVLFAIQGDNRVAVVHLTWSAQTESDDNYPATVMYHGWQDWVDRCLLPEYRRYRDTPR
ncbi:hypothetical protein [Fuerstiella marisgermanici]|uniref:Uncharacterized protein n=1 Tax=Fuerstiella marisgermanici TaxID=1891926 RepID=A0A1P8W923_9PLAN|nr:hypothetical protein [Fuerstiella marisgermanici]APZ90548.1 hypothetical protein Fuma_00127 [Fuerstiella marisgermanici]